MSTSGHFREHSFEVTDKVLRTKRKTYRLAQIEYVSVERPLLFIALPLAAGLAGVAIAFNRYLYPTEILVLAALAALLGIGGLTIGALRVHSLALRDEEVATSLGFVGTLRRVRIAVETAMAAADHQEARDEAD